MDEMGMGMLYTLEDEDGVMQQFELMDELDVGDDHYYALVPYYEDPQKELEADADLVVLKSEYEESGEEVLVTVDDDEEYEKIGNMFLQRLSEQFGED